MPGKKIYILLLLLCFKFYSYSQSCDDLMEYVKKEGGFGTSYSSYNSDFISKVTFYDIYIDYKQLYFAVVCLKSKSSFGCKEYLYQVGSNTKLNYAFHYLDSAGKAFWNYIQPHAENLNCSPRFE